MPVIRVLVVDDHRVVRSGLELLLGSADGIEVVGTADNGAEAVAQVGPTAPDVVLMDLSMPEMDGVEATRRITADHPDVRVLVLTSLGEQSKVRAAVEAGASGYLLKDSEPDALVNAVRAAGAGEVPLDPRVAGALLPGRAGTPVDRLSAREREVLTLVGKGMANKQIARQLGIAEKTVKAHLTQVFRAIDVADRTQAALWAERNGLLAD